MADFVYTSAKKKLLDGDIDLLVADIKVVLVDATDYTPAQATDEFLDDIPAAGRVATSANLANKTTTGGAFDADPASFTAVTGDGADMAVLYVDTGVEATSALICKLDSGVTGLPYTPSGADVLLNWGTYIFKLLDPGQVS